MFKEVAILHSMKKAYRFWTCTTGLLLDAFQRPSHTIAVLWPEQ